MNPLIFDVSGVVDKRVGIVEKYSFEGKIDLDDIETSSNVRGGIEIMKLEDGLNARISNGEVKIAFNCEKCLKPIIKKIKIDHTERQFLFDPPKKTNDPQDLYLVNKKNLTIDITEVLRQEIILHFPLNLVCSKSCKGLCPLCGKDKNKKNCSCKPEEPQKKKPLAKLKDLIK